MESLPQARMATGVSMTWVLYVLTDAPPLEWSHHDFGRIYPMPTPEERNAALADLGYIVADGAEWQWREPRHAPAPSHLQAVIPVRPATPAAVGGDTA
ncbi:MULTISPECIES: DUF6303 family protein [Streptomyces]|uniref:DUF6303 family protein n=1 Tax=Streptomyces TaxID=1883 RepID=UPI00192428B7|nr:DUF6303 family protein [Streptomyces silvae]MBL1286381.1 hypothetical protein [Streptomyces silvae]